MSFNFQAERFPNFSPQNTFQDFGTETATATIDVKKTTTTTRQGSLQTPTFARPGNTPARTTPPTRSEGDNTENGSVVKGVKVVFVSFLLILFAMN
jgi:hypothetical protein